MNPAGMMLSEVSQTQEDKYRTISTRTRAWRSQSHREKEVDGGARGWGRGWEVSVS